MDILEHFYTPGNLRLSGVSLFPNCPPEYCAAWAHEADPNDPEEGITTWAIPGPSMTTQIHTAAYGTALLLEVTRYGIRIVTNRNKGRGERGQLFYPKFSIPDAPSENYPIHRLLAGAKPGEIVQRDPIIPRDLRGADNRKAKGAAKGDAWETIKDHCKRLAVAAGATDLDGYMHNLEALYMACTTRRNEEFAA